MDGRISIRNKDCAMEKWEYALMKFLQPWMEQNCVLAALLTGSYATGNNNPSSDIDVHIVLSEEVDWRQRGNQVVDGYLVEYFANPARQIYAYMEEDRKCGSKADANMFCSGCVLFDKTGILSEIKERAANDLAEQLLALDAGSLAMIKYGIWDRYDELGVCHKTGSPYFINMYCSLLEFLLESYTRFLRTPKLPASKVYRFFKDAEYRKKYNLGNYPDSTFADLYLGCVEEKNADECWRLATELKDYVLLKMGGFEIDGWTFRSPLTV
jgi:hypothetical protein